MYQAFSKPDENIHLRELIPITWKVVKLDPIVITTNLIINCASEEISPKSAYQPASVIATVAVVQDEITF